MKQTATYILLFIITFSNLSAQETEDKQEELAKDLANPVANIISVPIQNNLNINQGNNNKNVNILNFQPVIPFANGKFVTRTIIPVVSVPSGLFQFENENGIESSPGSSGISDIVFTGFYVPKSKGLIWGFGPVIELPTGGSVRGSQKWSAGPSLLALEQKGDWTLGILANNAWSFAGDNDREDINHMLLNLFLVRQLGEGWYINSVPIITADWTAESGNQWTVPLGLGGGKLLMLGGKFPLNVQTGLYNNVVRPDFGPEWQWRFQVQFVFPKSMFGL
jgi:hypothetical protein